MLKVILDLLMRFNPSVRLRQAVTLSPAPCALRLYTVMPFYIILNYFTSLNVYYRQLT